MSCRSPGGTRGSSRTSWCAPPSRPGHADGEADGAADGAADADAAVAGDAEPLGDAGVTGAALPSLTWMLPESLLRSSRWPPDDASGMLTCSLPLSLCVRTRNAPPRGTVTSMLPLSVSTLTSCSLATSMPTEPDSVRTVVWLPAIPSARTAPESVLTTRAPPTFDVCTDPESVCRLTRPLMLFASIRPESV